MTAPSLAPLSCAAFQRLIPHFEGEPLSCAAKDGVSYEVWCEHFRTCPACSGKVLAHRMIKAGHDPASYPCIHMAYRATGTCEQHPNREECNDLFVAHSEVFDEYSLIKPGGSLLIDYCPWCGTQLPPSQRDRWF
ncbi:MAG: hypothetical protein ABL907_26140, partial [Hyphomicrobium sp.]